MKKSSWPAIAAVGLSLFACRSPSNGANLKETPVVATERTLTLVGEQLIGCDVQAAGCAAIGAARETLFCFVTVGEKSFFGDAQSTTENTCMVAMRVRKKLCDAGIEAAAKTATCLQQPLGTVAPPPDPFAPPPPLPTLYTCRGETFDAPGGVVVRVGMSNHVGVPLLTSLSRLDGSNIRSFIETTATVTPHGVELTTGASRPARILLDKPQPTGTFPGTYIALDGSGQFPLVCKSGSR
jgi:hypothetical protein